MLKSILLCSFFFLCGCGFKPLYKTSSTETYYHLSQIKVGSIANREGQLLRERLCYLLTPYGQPESPLYALSVNLKFSERNLSFAKDSTTTQEATDLAYTFTLSDSKTGKTIHSGGETVSIDNTVSVQSPYSNWAGEKDVRKRLVREASENIRLNLATLFTEGHPVNSKDKQ